MKIIDGMASCCVTSVFYRIMFQSQGNTRIRSAGSFASIKRKIITDAGHLYNVRQSSVVTYCAVLLLPLECYVDYQNRFDRHIDAQTFLPNHGILDLIC